jgi:hypothetical protein
VLPVGTEFRNNERSVYSFLKVGLSCWRLVCDKKTAPKVPGNFEYLENRWHGLNVTSQQPLETIVWICDQSISVGDSQ